MKEQDVRAWLDTWPVYSPNEVISVEVKKDGCGNVCLIAVSAKRGSSSEPLVIGEYPDKVEL